MNMRPINARVLVKPLEGAKTTAGGIHLPETAKEGHREGEVIAIAEDATEEVAVGDRVIYTEFAGTEVTLEGEKYALLPCDDLLARYEAADVIPD